MIVYVDIYLIENFIVNLFLLLLAFKALRFEYSKKRIYISAIVGAVYSLLLFFNELGLLISLPMKIIIAFIMVAIASKNNAIKSKLKVTCMYLVGSCTLAGICFGASLFNNSYSIFNGYEVEGGSTKTLILLVLLVYIVVTRINDYIRERNTVDNLLYDIEIPIKGTKLVVRAFLDTGNALREPVTNLPCIIIEQDLFKILKCDKEEFYHISFDTISDKGTLVGVKKEKIKIISKGNVWRQLDVILCECPNKLSVDNEFNALLSRGII